MIYEANPIAVVIFISFVAFVLGLSFYFGKKGSSAKSYFAAGGEIHWGVNGVAFAGDYLSAASFLGICGMIAVAGYDGFLYSIGYLAGWMVAMFVVAEPMKRLGKYTFADALDAKFNSKGIQLMAGISTLIVSIFYLIPQMVGAGVLVTPLLGLPHYAGVIIVGVVVTIIVSTAGMKSTTYVQFLKGALLLIFSTILVIIVLINGFKTKPSDDFHQYITLTPSIENGAVVGVEEAEYSFVKQIEVGSTSFIKIMNEKGPRWWELREDNGSYSLVETLTIESTPEVDLFNGLPKEAGAFYSVGSASRLFKNGVEVQATGALGIFGFFKVINDSEIIRYKKVQFSDSDNSVMLWHQVITPGNEVLRPGLKFPLDKEKGATPADKLNFISLMLALFFGTAALPHILIRYYTVSTPSAARKSTIVAIAGIGLFYILTMYMGFGAMFNGVMDVQDGNMAAPLLAKHFGVVLFAIISAIAFATILGTVSGLIVASSGAVAHDLVDKFMGKQMTDKVKVLVGKGAAIVVGIIAIALGILFEGMNVAYLVGWAFAVAASANLPSILMLLFWKRTTSVGIIASITTGIITSMGIILLSSSMFAKYGLDPASAPFPIDNPAIFSIPLSFLALIIGSLLTQKKKSVA
ncbi:MAG: cation acetate symporter [Spirochaetales bacterium]|nr:cation acetate symporter [Spirochaetales bacterium]